MKRLKLLSIKPLLMMICVYDHMILYSTTRQQQTIDKLMKCTLWTMIVFTMGCLLILIVYEVTSFATIVNSFNITVHNKTINNTHILLNVTISAYGTGANNTVNYTTTKTNNLQPNEVIIDPHGIIGITVSVLLTLGFLLCLCAVCGCCVNSTSGQNTRDSQGGNDSLGSGHPGDGLGDSSTLLDACKSCKKTSDPNNNGGNNSGTNGTSSPTKSSTKPREA